MAGSTPWNQPPPSPIAPTSMFGNPSTFTAAANTQVSDYDKIMKQYGDIANSATSNRIVPNFISPGSVSAPKTANFAPVNYSSIAPQLSKYEQSGDVTSSLAGLSNLATTGGYDEAGIAALRARGVAPTRSIYANAQQNIERQRALGGGYSPNFNATQAKLARDESNQISDINTNVNAGIAQNVASNRIAAAPSYASASANANAAQTASDRANADIINQINELNARNQISTDQFNTSGMNEANKFNIEGANRVNEANVNRQFEAARINAENQLRSQEANRNTALSATEGMRGLYGTTPALTNTFGNQVVQAGQLGQGQQQLNQQNQNGLLNFATRYGG